METSETMGLEMGQSDFSGLVRSLISMMKSLLAGILVSTLMEMRLPLKEQSEEYTSKPTIGTSTTSVSSAITSSETVSSVTVSSSAIVSSTNVSSSAWSTSTAYPFSGTTSLVT